MHARATLALAVLLAACAAPAHPRTRAPADFEWRSYGHDPGGMRFSPLAQIDRGNVWRLVRAWTYHTGELETRSDSASARDARRPPAFETTPLMVDGVL
jgi:quinoprotein glucose dehydrogenase